MITGTPLLCFQMHSFLFQGCIEIEDQVEALLHIAEQTSYIDITRVAIHGWSYGNISSLVGILPEVRL